MSSLPTLDFEGLKKLAKSFLNRLPGASSNSIENGWKMFSLAYLNTQMTAREVASDGPALFQVIRREYLLALEAL